VSCDEMQALVHAYVDGELDLMRSVEIERHLQDCPACSQIYRSQQALSASLNSEALYFKPPTHLQGRIQASIRKEGRSRPASPLARTIPWRLLSVAAVLVFAIGVTWLVARAMSAPSLSDDTMAQDVVAAHVRSLMASHLSDVASSDKHTVKPWFNGKLDFSPPVEDLASRGFPLIGGRLDYLDGRPVAALIYQRQKHFINLFVWPSADGLDTADPALTRQGYNMFHWTDSGMTYWAVSDLNSTELQEFVQLFQQAARSAATPTPSP
jgi:anti-sigma factor RsiW